MARCERCNACTSMWDIEPCYNCNWPLEDKRDAAQVEQDEADYQEYWDDQMYDDPEDNEGTIYDSD